MILSEKISEITENHLMNNNGVLMSQCTTAVGWIGGTVPKIYDNDKIIELPTSDVSNGAIAVGFALANRRPIYVIRYAGFMTYNAASLVNYAAKSKEMWKIPCPVFIRCLTMENSIGPVAGGAYHSPVMRMPGIPVFAPITPGEWEETWNYYMSHDDPVLCSEHRLTYKIDYEMNHVIKPEAKLTVFAISYARVNALEAIKDLPCNLIHIKKLKPFEISDEHINGLKSSGKGLVIDTDYEICGASRSIAYELSHKANVPVFSLAIEDRTAGFATHTDNVTPSVKKIRDFINNINK